jgi:cobalt-precorrin-5B (C1)-methyltransferase
MAALAALAGVPAVAAANTVAEAFTLAPALGEAVASRAWMTAVAALEGAPIEVDVAVFGRDGQLLARHGR